MWLLEAIIHVEKVYEQYSLRRFLDSTFAN